jgi:hypothetical protein
MGPEGIVGVVLPVPAMSTGNDDNDDEGGFSAVVIGPGDKEEMGDVEMAGD